MEIYCRNRGAEEYVEVKVGLRQEEFVKHSGFAVRMLEENDIPGVIRPVAMEIDGILYLMYAISSFCSLNKLFLNVKPDGMLLGYIASSLVGGIRQMDSYMLETDDLVIDTEYMFFDQRSKGVYLICIPGYGVPIKRQMKNLLEYIMKIFDYRDVEGMRYLYGLYDAVTNLNAGMESIVEYMENGQSDTQNVLMLEKMDIEADDVVVMNEAEKTEEQDKENDSTIASRILPAIFLLAAMFVVMAKYLYHGRNERDLFFFLCLFVAFVTEIVMNLLFKSNTSD